MARAANHPGPSPSLSPRRAGRGEPRHFEQLTRLVISEITPGQEVAAPRRRLDPGFATRQENRLRPLDYFRPRMRPCRAKASPRRPRLTSGRASLPEAPCVDGLRSPSMTRPASCSPAATCGQRREPYLPERLRSAHRDLQREPHSRRRFVPSPRTAPRAHGATA